MKQRALQRLNALKEKYTKDSTKLEVYKKQKQEQENELELLKKENEEVLTMKELLEQSSDEARRNGKEVLAKTASSSLQMVMGDHLSVDIALAHRSGVPVADMEIVSEYNGVKHRIDPHDDGGGLRDLVSLSTFLATGFLVAGNNQAPYILDEPTKFVSKEYAEKTAHAMKDIMDYTEKQSIIVTHERDHLPYVADRSYELVKNEDGETEITRLV